MSEGGGRGKKRTRARARSPDPRSAYIRTFVKLSCIRRAVRQDRDAIPQLGRLQETLFNATTRRAVNGSEDGFRFSFFFFFFN